MVEIKTCDITDSIDISGIEEECFKIPWSIQLITESFENPSFTYIGAKDNGKLVGFIGYYKIMDEFHIANVAVTKAYRRQHIADRLIKESIKRAKEQNIVGLTLEVREHNKAAIDLYLNNGFVSSGIRPKYYQDGENAIIMWKRF